MFSTVAKFRLFTFLYFYSVSLQTRLGAIVTTWLQILWCVGVARRRHRGLRKDLQITPDNISILIIKGGQ
ncbi:MAG: hypothetical protein RM347_009485 [Nostoc sp. ChiQUE02]|uniref:hypothetical protein n=1 Tax=Nostoc sp. ChiQUE02 TaxID=3075377 RepID=UPI002AD2B500|nr:hypothetical protein [Nostoc sp. ChiQUE02]